MTMAIRRNTETMKAVKQNRALLLLRVFQWRRLLYLSSFSTGEPSG